MLRQLRREYDDIIRDAAVKKFRREAGSYELVCILHLCDKSTVYVRDYLFRDGARKYSYHWQAENGEFLGRWDNAPHWPDVKTHPHHFHRDDGTKVVESRVRDMKSLCEILREKLK